ncbi:MAG TPA: divergent polysaccharide deacetylase family protein [Candidatus Margulisiibacteriota bacterium]|nr:divergent polysaccharide deacetylase family protein [Candidatus Margulisiibacteriota bacterium]
MQKVLKYKIALIVLSLLVVSQCLFIITSRPKKAAVPPAVQLKGKIAIVLDDWGYNLNNMDLVEGIKYPLTASVLPGLTYSEAISDELHSRGFEIILHLPLEPQEKYRLEKNTVMVSQGEEEIRGIVTDDLSKVKFVRGVSNHMGSLATQDPRVMRVIFEELKKRKMFFLDSFASPRSICAELAAKVNLPFAKRNIFLDNNSDPGYIREQLHRLKMRARVKGSAIGIGHDRRNTLEVLKEVMPQIEKEGYKFVFVSELAR